MKDQLKQFKGLELTTKTAEAYAKVRLGLGDDWCAYAYALHISECDEISTFENIDKNPIKYRSFLERTDADILNDGQIIIKLINAPSVELVSDNWFRFKEKTFLVDWELVQEMLK